MNGYEIVNKVLLEMPRSKVIRRSVEVLGKNIKKDPASLALLPIPGGSIMATTSHLIKNKGSRNAIKYAAAKMNPNRTHDKYVDPGENAPKTTEWIAPILALARRAIVSSGSI